MVTSRLPPLDNALGRGILEAVTTGVQLTCRCGTPLTLGRADLGRTVEDVPVGLEWVLAHISQGCGFVSIHKDANVVMSKFLEMRLAGEC
jgi:hypothetical protein